MSKHPLCEEPFPKIQSKSPLTQLHAISSGPVIAHQRDQSFLKFVILFTPETNTVIVNS